ncbi:MAG: DMT family transporter [Rhodobacteraceae bacterium]|nr:DMT family transporter [Paracoccaceae bacterium]
MSLGVFLTILFAAALHASWNAIVKSGADKTLAMGAVVLGHIPIAVIAVFFVPFPSGETWPYIAAGVALHMGYQLFLIQSYKHGDLTQVYPIARGVAPLIVTVVSLLALGVALSSLQVAAVACIAVGIISLGLLRSSNGVRNPRAVFYALGTGVFIASYSLVDGMGARVGGSSVAYYSWLSIINGAAMTAYMACAAPGTIRAIPRDGKVLFFVGGGVSFLAYAIVTWAFTQAPIALVTALRETSIIIALFIGVIWLGERLTPGKIAATIAAVFGAVLLQLAV